MKKIVLIFLFFLFRTDIFAEPTFVGSTELRESRHATGITFNPDGTKMYILSSQARNNNINDSSVDKLIEYDLSSPFSLVDAEASSAATEEDIREDCGGVNSLMNPTDLHWNEDGKVLFITETTNNAEPNVCQVDINTAYDITELAERSDSGFNMNDGSATDVSAVGTSADGIDFSNDGLKLFIVGKNDDKVFEFSLSSKFNLTGAAYTGNFFDTSSTVSEPAAMRFSKDGKQLFINDATDDKIVQWSLSTAFDLTSTITLRGSFSIRADYQSVASNSNTAILEGLEFNNDGSKFFITTGQRNNTANSHFALEYNLDCPYGIVYCESPVSGSDKDMIGVIESYTEISKRVMKNNIKPVMHRLEWLRRHRKNNNLTNQNIKFNFSNEMLASLAKVMPIANKENSTNEEQQGDWFFWSEGQISIGDIEATSGPSRKELDTNGITIGADKKASENKMYGYALQFGRDSADIGNSTALLDTDNYSLVLYGTIPHEDGRFLDAALGLSTLKTSHLRKKHSVNLTGKRDGKQAFGSIKLNKVYYKKNININPTAKFDFGFTELNTFQESGSNDALIYEKHQIPKGFASLGMLVDKTKKFNNGNVLKPMARLEYTADFSPSTNTNVSYVGTPSTDHFIRIGNQSTHNYNAGLGFDLSTVTGWSVILNYEIDYANGSGHTDNLNFIAGWVPKSETEYALSINGSENIKAGFNIVKKVRGFDLKFNIDSDLLYENRSQNAKISLNKVF